LHAARADINARLKARSHYDDDVVIEHVDTHTLRCRTATYRKVRQRNSAHWQQR